MILIKNCVIKISVSDQNGDEMSFGQLYWLMKDNWDKMSVPRVVVKYLVRQPIHSSGKLQ